MPNRWTPKLVEWLKATAADSGFDASGIADAGPDSTEAERFTDWIAAGRAGEMDYLKRCDPAGRLNRSDLQVAIPWARSVVVCAMNYNAAGPRSIDAAPAATGWIARYAWSGRDTEPGAGGRAATDYHDVLLSRLKGIEAALRERAECETRCYVDTGPLVERRFASKAGVGWIGKNTCVLNQQLGSWLLLGVIVTSLPLDSAALPEVAADRCGSCTRCIDACPTAALVAPREMDASLCIAYLTIEKKGPIAEELRTAMGRQVFGCDICQDVCPWNRRAPVADKPGMRPRADLVNPNLASLGSLDSAAFRKLFRQSPLERTGNKRLKRNVAIAMGNSGEQGFVEPLERWSKNEDQVLAEASRWALERLRAAAQKV